MRPETRSGVGPGDRVCVIGAVALPVIREACEKFEGELKAKYPGFLKEKLENTGAEAPSEFIAQLSEGNDVKYLQELGEFGIYDALWKLAAEEKKGLRIEIRNIPLSVAAVEVCETAGINPYESDSRGAYLAVTPNSGELIRLSGERGINCTDIGYITADNDKLLVNKDHIGYLNKRR